MILFIGFKFGSLLLVHVLPHEAKWDVQYTNTKWARI